MEFFHHVSVKSVDGNGVLISAERPATTSLDVRLAGWVSWLVIQAWKPLVLTYATSVGLAPKLA